MQVLHVLDNQGGYNDISYIILYRKWENELIVSFSGTENTEQLITEIAESFPVYYDIHPQDNAYVFDYFYAHYLAGFREDFLSTMRKYASTFWGSKIIFTGHSLGGALTVHAAADAILSGILDNRNVYIYTFGQPRVGDHQFYDQFIPKVKGLYRLIHYKDLVAHIPPCIPDFSSGCINDGILPFYPYHVPQEIFYSEDFSSYKVCNGTDGEDPTCSNDSMNISIADHLEYFNINIGSLFIELTSPGPSPLVSSFLKSS